MFNFVIDSAPLWNYVVAYGLLAAVLFVIAIFVLTQNPRHALNRVFSAYSFSIAWWSFFTIPMIISENRGSAYLWDQICLVGAIFIPTTFIHFVLVFLRLANRYSKWILACYFTSLFFLLLNTTPQFVSDVVPLYSFNFYTVPGIAYHAYVAYFSFLSTLGVLMLFWAYRKSKSDKNKFDIQTKWLFFSSLLGYLGGGTNFMLVYGIEIPYVTPFANYAVLAYGISVAYIILRYRFLDIEVIIKKTIVFAGLFALVMTIVGLMTAVTQALIGKFFTIRPSYSLAIGVILAIYLYEPTRRFLINLTDQFLFQKRFDYRKLLKDASMGLTRITSLKRQLNLMSHFLTMRARIKSVSIFMPEGEREDYVLKEFRSSNGQLQPDKIIYPQAEIVRYLKREYKNPFLRFYEVDELAEGYARNLQAEKYDFKIIREEMIRLHADLIIASFYQSHLNGILVLGPKKSDEIYTDEDINVFAAIAQESAIAIENARLFDEKIRRTVELEGLNRELEQSNERLRETQASLIVAEKNATMVGMAKAIGHEVYNPLCTVEGRAELLERKMKQIMPRILELSSASNNGDDAELNRATFETMIDYVKRIESSARRIKVAVQTLTNILKESKGEMTALNFLVLWKESVEATRFSTYDENLSFCDFKENIKANLLIFGNLEQLMQVFTNLIKNAYEAMSGIKQRQISIKAEVDPKNPKMARIEFADNGPGMTKEIQRKIFQQGFTTKVAKDKGIGTAGQGQGLYVCKHIIESVHKGEMSVESEVGQGAKFIILLPLAEAEEVALEQSA